MEQRRGDGRRAGKQQPVIAMTNERTLRLDLAAAHHRRPTDLERGGERERVSGEVPQIRRERIARPPSDAVIASSGAGLQAAQCRRSLVVGAPGAGLWALLATRMSGTSRAQGKQSWKNRGVFLCHRTSSIFH
jgi:hypothetical protein